jgi:hypothetical protein
MDESGWRSGCVAVSCDVKLIVQCRRAPFDSHGAGPDLCPRCMHGSASTSCCRTVYRAAVMHV